MIAAGSLVLLLLMDAYVRDSPEPRNDELIYERMAESPFEPHTFPFAFRVGVPTLVHLLPFGHTFSFSALAWLSTAGCAALGYVLLTRFPVDRRLAAALSVLLALSPTLFIASLRQGRIVDPESVLIMLAGTIAIVDRRPAVFGAILLVGATIRESALFLIPFAYAVWAERLWDPRAARQTLVASLPGVALYATIRLSVPALYREQVIGYGSLLDGRREVLRTALDEPQVELRRLAIAFGALWLAAPFALRESRFARAGLVLAACCAVAMLFALDWGRIAFLALPVVLVAGALVLTHRPRLALATIACLVALDVGYAIYMEDFGGAQEGIIDVNPSSYPAR